MLLGCPGPLPSSRAFGRALPMLTRSSAPWLTPIHWGNLAEVIFLAALGQHLRATAPAGLAVSWPNAAVSALHSGGLAHH